MSEKSESKNKVTIIIPAKNEENNIRDIIRMVKKADVHEIIIVDGFSNDRTIEFAKIYPNQPIALNKKPKIKK